MSVLRFIISVSAVANFLDLASAIYNPSCRANVAVYWGQGAGQQRLLHFCQQSTIDIIPIGFMNVFPDQGNGFPGTNFGNQCWGGRYVYDGPGNNPLLNSLQTECPQINEDIPICQTAYGKKIILSLGGGTNTYQLTGAASGIAFADFVWGAFGPQKADWVRNGLPRPFDSPTGGAVEVDGFDFDIEYASIDNSAGYIAMINRLRTLFKTTSKQYLITGAPQCMTPDANMAQMIAQSQFDIIFVQYYNTPQCSARNWANANSNFGSSGVEIASGFSYNSWASFLAGTASADAKLYIGVPGAPDAFYLTPDEISKLAKAYFCKPNFGGIMIWEATVAESNPSGPYYTSVKNILSNYAADTSFPCYASPSAIVARSTTVSSSTRISSTRATTSTKGISTSIKPVSSIKTTSTPLSVRATASSKTTALPTIKLSSSSKSTLVIISTKATIASKSSTLPAKSTLKLSSSSKLSSPTMKLSSSAKISSPTPKSSILAAKSTLKPSSSAKLSSTIKPSSSVKISSPPPKLSTSTKLPSPTSLKPTSTTKPPSSTKPPLSTSKPTSTTLKPSPSPSITTSTQIVKKSVTSTARGAKSTVVVPVGACGKEWGTPCPVGNCCSQYGWCGVGSAYCGVGCQVGFGVCS